MTDPLNEEHTESTTPELTDLPDVSPEPIVEQTVEPTVSTPAPDEQDLAPVIEEVEEVVEADDALSNDVSFTDSGLGGGEGVVVSEEDSAAAFMRDFMGGGGADLDMPDSSRAGMNPDDYMASFMAEEIEDPFVEQERFEASEKERGDEINSFAGDLPYIFRQGIQGLANIPDLALTMTSLLAMLPEELEELDDIGSFVRDNASSEKIKELEARGDLKSLGFFQAGAETIPEFDQFMHEILRNTGLLAQDALDKGFSVSGLVSEVIKLRGGSDDNLKPRTTAGKWTGTAVRAVTESLVISSRIAHQAKHLKNFDDLPGFMKPLYEKFKINPKAVFTEEGYAAMFAAMSGEAAAEWYLDNFGTDNEAAAAAVGFVAAIAGGTVRKPVSIVKTGVVSTVKGALSVPVVAGSLIRKGAQGTSRVIGPIIDNSPTASRFLNDNLFGKALKWTGQKISGDMDAEKLHLNGALEIIEEAKTNPEFREMLDNLIESMDVEGGFRNDLKAALKVGDELGLKVTTSTASEDAGKFGITAIAEQADPIEFLRTQKKNVNAIYKFFDKISKEGTPEDIERLKVVSRQAHRRSLDDIDQTTVAIEDVLRTIQHNAQTDVGGAGKQARKDLQNLKSLYAQLSDQIYQSVDPFNEIDLPLRNYVGMWDALQEPVQTAGHVKMRQHFGEALANTLTVRASKRLTSVTSAEIKKIRAGDQSAMKRLSDLDRVLSYNEADKMSKAMRQSATDLRTPTPGGGDEARHARRLHKLTLKGMDEALLATGNQQALITRTRATDYYRFHIGNQFDPQKTSVGRLLREDKPDLFAVNEFEALDSFFNNPKAMDEFMDLTNPAGRGEALVDTKGSLIGQFLTKNNIAIEEEAATTMATLRKAMKSHIIELAAKSTVVDSGDPRTALLKWMEKNRKSLEYFPELADDILKQTQSPSMNSPALDAALEARSLAEATARRLEVTNLFGPGGLGKNSAMILEDNLSTDHVNRTLKAIDTTGRLRATLVSGMITNVVKKTDDLGGFDIKQIQSLLDNKNFIKLAPKETVEALQLLAQGQKIVSRGNISVSRFTPKAGEDPNVWLIQNMAKLWTTLRTRETLNVNRTNLALIHVASEVTHRLGKIDKKTGEKFAKAFADILVDPELADEVMEGIARLAKAGSNAEQIAATVEVSRMFARFGLGISPYAEAVMVAAQEPDKVEGEEDE